MFNMCRNLLGLVFVLITPISQSEEYKYNLSPFLGHKDGYQLPTEGSSVNAPKGTMLGIYGGVELNRSYSWDVGFQQRKDLQTIDDARTSALESAVKYDYFLRNDYSIYGRLGAVYWDMEKPETILKGISPMAELGVSYWFPRNLRLSAGYQYIDDIADYNSHMVLVSAIFTFNDIDRRVQFAENRNVISELIEDEPIPQQTLPVTKPSNAIHFDTDSDSTEGE